MIHYAVILKWDPTMQGKLISRTRQLLDTLDKLALEKNERGERAKAYAKKIRSGWADLAGGRTFTIYESDPADARSYNPWYGPFAWNDIARVEVIPVMTVEHLMGLLKENNDPILNR